MGFSRLARIGAAAAVLVAGGGIYSTDYVQAWLDANTADGDPYTDVSTLRHDALAFLQRAPMRVYALVDAGWAPPVAFDHATEGGHWIGECGSGVCSVPIHAGSYVYRFEITSNATAQGGRRLAMAVLHPYLVRSWRWLGDHATEVTFLGAHKDIQANCIASGLTGAQCLALYHELQPCYVHTDGSVQRYGIHQYPGGSAAIDPPTVAEIGAGTWTPIVCDARGGEDPVAYSTTWAVPADNELDF